MSTPHTVPVGALLELLSRPIAFQQAYARLPGQNALSALLLSQMNYWSTRTPDKSGWFYKTQEEWHRETGMTRTELQTARKRLRDAKYIQERRKGNPAKIYFYVNASKIEADLWTLLESKKDNKNNSLQESCNQGNSGKYTDLSKVCMIPAIKNAGFLQSRMQDSCKLSTESTTESTTEIKPSMSEAGAQTKKEKLWGQEFDYDSARLMFSLLFRPEDQPKEPNWDRWANCFRLMRTQDGRTEERITYMIKWIARDPFESHVVLSPEKMRKRFDSLAVKIRSYKEQRERQHQNMGGTGNVNGNGSTRQRVRDVFGDPSDKSWAEGLLIPSDGH